MRIQHNITAMNSYRNYNINNSQLSKNLEKLSSGYRINRAGDDAAGLAISEKMRAQISGLEQATRNAKDGISLVQTAEGALTEVHDMLNRMYTLAEQAANGTYGDTEREKLNSEVSQLKDEIDRISETANFNGKLLFSPGDGTQKIAGKVISGDSTLLENSRITVNGDNIDPEALSALQNALGSGQNLTTSMTINSAGQVRLVLGGFTDSTAATQFDAIATIVPASSGGTNSAGLVSADNSTSRSATVDATAAPLSTGAAALNGASVKVTIKKGDKVALEYSVQLAKDTGTRAAKLSSGGKLEVGISNSIKSAKSTKTDATKAASNSGVRQTQSLGLVATSSIVSRADTPAASSTSSSDSEGLGIYSTDGRSGGNTFSFAIGEVSSTYASADGKYNNILTINYGGIDTSTLGIKDISLETDTDAAAALDAITAAIEDVSTTRGYLGAIQNRLDHTINNLGVMRENIQDAESTIRDTDVAEEMMKYTKNSILNQSAQAMLAQANQLPQGVLSLLQ